jgi:hypothetical protein
VVSGFDLLLHQAARQVELMTGIKPAPLEAMRAAGQAELGRPRSGPRYAVPRSGQVSHPFCLVVR